MSEFYRPKEITQSMKTVMDYSENLLSKYKDIWNPDKAEYLVVRMAINDFVLEERATLYIEAVEKQKVGGETLRSAKNDLALLQLLSLRERATLGYIDARLQVEENFATLQKTCSNKITRSTESGCHDMALDILESILLNN